MTMSIATAIHSKRLIGTAMKYCPVPSCYSNEEHYLEPEYIMCPSCNGTGYDEDEDECDRCDGDGCILNPKRHKKKK